MDKKFLKGEQDPKQYLLISVIGKGGFGTVYKAENVINKENVAIKIFKNYDNVIDTDVLENWKREAKQSLSIKAPHVINAIEFQSSKVDDSDIYYLVMEFADGDSLKKLLETNKQSKTFLTEAFLKDIFVQSLEGLKSIHDTSLHRDIKPENLLLVNNVLKISDFGLAKYIDENTRTKTYKGWGTYKYMAPESWVLGTMSKATDIYSLGIVFYELATLQLPYSSADEKELEELHKFGKIPSVKDINPDLSLRIEGIIRKMMQKSSADRYQTAEEIIEVLNKPDLDHQSDIEPTLLIAKQILQRREMEKSENAKLDEESNQIFKANKYKIQEFFDLVASIVEEINTSIPEEKLWLSKGNDNDYSLIWDKKDLLRFRFNPSIFESKLKINELSIMASGYCEIVGSSRENEGINFILSKGNNPDQYGTWKVLEIISSPLLPRPSYPLAVLYDVLERISKMGNTMDIFQHTVRDDIALEIKTYIQKAFEYVNKPPDIIKDASNSDDLESMFDEEDNGYNAW